MTTKYDNSGSLSKNKRKEKPSHPDLKGQATVDGVGYWISGWRKDGEDGIWYSLAFDKKEERNGTAPKRKVDDDDDIPL
jgi:hypothetical protein